MTIPLSAEMNSAPVPQFAKNRSAAKPGFIAGVATVLAGQVACAVLALGMEICYARFLGPAGRGQISLCMIVIAVMVVLGGIGGEIPIIAWSADPNRRVMDWLPAICLSGLMGCAAASGIWCAIYWWWHPAFLRGVTPTLAVLVLLTVPVSIFLNYIMALLTGRERFGARTSLALVSQVAEFVCVISLLLIVSRSAAMALAGNALGVLVAGIAGAYFLRNSLRGFWRFDRAAASLQSAVSLGLRGQFGNLVTFVSYRLDVFVVNLFLDPAQVGLYALGVVVSESLWQIPNAVAVALFPRTARTLDQGAGAFTCFVTRQVILLSCILGLGLAIASPVVIPLLFGARFDASIAVIWWILPGTIALSTSKVLSADITARGRPEYNSIVALVGGIVTIVLDFGLIPRFGIRGAALASSLTYFVEAVFIGLTARKLIGVSLASLFIPARSDLEAYRDAWQRLKLLRRPLTTPVS